MDKEMETSIRVKFLNQGILCPEPSTLGRDFLQSLCISVDLYVITLTSSQARLTRKAGFTRMLSAGKAHMSHSLNSYC